MATPPLAINTSAAKIDRHKISGLTGIFRCNAVTFLQNASNCAVYAGSSSRNGFRYDYFCTSTGSNQIRQAGGCFLLQAVTAFSQRGKLQIRLCCRQDCLKNRRSPKMRKKLQKFVADRDITLYNVS
jgi:hypothetical protein